MFGWFLIPQRILSSLRGEGRTERALLGWRTQRSELVTVCCVRGEGRTTLWQRRRGVLIGGPVNKPGDERAPSLKQQRLQTWHDICQPAHRDRSGPLTRCCHTGYEPSLRCTAMQRCDWSEGKLAEMFRRRHGNWNLNDVGTFWMLEG
jgi:hypothetical protein